MLQSYAKKTVLVNTHSVHDNTENEFDIFQIHEKREGLLEYVGL